MNIIKYAFQDKKLSIAEAFVLETGTLFIIGTFFKLGFYIKLNAVWVINFFSPVNFLLANIKLCAFYITPVTYLSFINSPFQEKNKWLGGIKAILILNCPVFFISLFNIGFATLDYALISGVFLTYAVLNHSKNINLQFLAAMTLIILIPIIYGYLEARKILVNPDNPITYLKLNNSIQQFEIIDSFSDKVVLKDTNGNLKIIDVKELPLIHMKELK